ncbi:hypothetical protein AJ79_03657 [Helicocarpus griseus UAMH5409]|uniref:Uncharacterized protein n=1 Tax=Helicocarpus griseus UAMH5409 TaxID=1447875 RepID=A0A2B7XXU2_9EURO|nr:hypothetical protein AJ79_03657 [Helicocarpus griseus UAMH5409]
MAFRQVIINGRVVVISVAEMVNTGPNSAFYRPLQVLQASNPTLVDETLDMAVDAIKKPGVIPVESRDKLCRVQLTSMDHPSPEDTREHSTDLLLDEEGAEFGKIHVTKNPSLQGPARLNPSSNAGTGGQGGGTWKILFDLSLA